MACTGQKFFRSEHGFMEKRIGEAKVFHVKHIKLLLGLTQTGKELSWLNWVQPQAKKSTT